MPAPEDYPGLFPESMRECAEYHTKACCGQKKAGCSSTFFDDLMCYKECMDDMILNGDEFSAACKAEETEIIRSMQKRNLMISVSSALHAAE